MTHSSDSHGEILPASNPGAGQIDVGMVVVGADGHNLGKVKEIRASDFLLNRPFAHDLYVPFQFIMSVPDMGDDPPRPNEVVLTVPAEHLDKQGWQRA